MYNLKLLSFAALMLATQVCAGRISYSTSYKQGGIRGDGATEQKAGGTIPDDKDDLVLDNIKDWSNDRFKAKRNIRSQVIIVSSKEKVDSKDEALTANNDAQQLVNQHI